MDITWLDIWKFHGAALLAGCVIDWIIGDPLWLPHPVRLMGTMIAGMESRLRQRSGGMERRAVPGRGHPRVHVHHMVVCSVGSRSRAEQLCLDRAWALLLPAEGFLCSLMLAARGLVYREHEGVPQSGGRPNRGGQI